MFCVVDLLKLFNIFAASESSPGNCNNETPRNIPTYPPILPKRLSMLSA